MKKDEKDLELWTAWNRSKSPQDLEALLKVVTPLIHYSISQLRGSISDRVLEAEAKINAVKAFKSFDPNRGVKLSTHVTNYLKKTNRIVYNNMELLSVPEKRRIKFKNYEASVSNLREELGRTPNAQEVSSDLKWSMSEVARHKQESWKELSASNPNVSDVSFNSDPNTAIVSYVYNDLNPVHQSVFEMTTGYGGSSVNSNKSIMRELKLTQGQLSYAKTKIKKKLQIAIGQYGG